MEIARKVIESSSLGKAIKYTLTELGRNLPTKARTKHNIKRIDRLLCNRHLHEERFAVYRWHASFI